MPLLDEWHVADMLHPKLDHPAVGVCVQVSILACACAQCDPVLIASPEVSSLLGCGGVQSLPSGRLTTCKRKNPWTNQSPKPPPPTFFYFFFPSFQICPSHQPLNFHGAGCSWLSHTATQTHTRNLKLLRKEVTVSRGTMCEMWLELLQDSSLKPLLTGRRFLTWAVWSLPVVFLRTGKKTPLVAHQNRAKLESSKEEDASKTPRLRGPFLFPSLFYSLFFFSAASSPGCQT